MRLQIYWLQVLRQSGAANLKLGKLTSLKGIGPMSWPLACTDIQCCWLQVLRQSGGALELVDESPRLPELQRGCRACRPGP